MIPTYESCVLNWYLMISFFYLLIFSMNRTHYKFERIPHLRLLDLKAQKKNINCKKFMDIPLTFEETIAAKISD